MLFFCNTKILTFIYLTIKKVKKISLCYFFVVFLLPHSKQKKSYCNHRKKHEAQTQKAFGRVTNSQFACCVRKERDSNPRNP